MRQLLWTLAVLAAASLLLDLTEATEKNPGPPPGSCSERTDSNGRRELYCFHLGDDSFPLTGFSGHFDQITLEANYITRLPRKAFGDAYATNYYFVGHSSLLKLKKNFLGSGKRLKHTKSIIIQSAPLLESFDWQYIGDFPNLEEFTLNITSISSIPSQIPWSGTVRNINLDVNRNVLEVPAFAFARASGLESLSILYMNRSVVIRSNAFYITSEQMPALSLSFLPYGDAPVGSIEDNAFGNIDGGRLFSTIAMNSYEFTEGAFRHLLKSAYNLEETQFLLRAFADYPIQAGADCASGCSIAWLYQDSRWFGLDQYLALVGTEDVICPGYGPVLQPSPEFQVILESCPDDPYEWPGPNYCSGNSANDPVLGLTADPHDCRCFYQCVADAIDGHVCCADGLVFHPDLAVCVHQWDHPDCDAGTGGPATSGCPDGFESVRGGCYKNQMYSAHLNWAEADAACKNEDGGDHLWSFETEKEYECVINKILGARQGRSGARGMFWTDGKLVSSTEGVWEDTGKPIKYIPEQGLYPVCCSGQGCGGVINDGQCLTVGTVSFGAADSGLGLLGCECDGETKFGYVCEKDLDGPAYVPPPDVSPECECKPDGLSAVQDNDACFYNCFSQVGGVECCPDGTVFVEWMQDCR